MGGVLQYGINLLQVFICCPSTRIPLLREAVREKTMFNQCSGHYPVENGCCGPTWTPKVGKIMTPKHLKKHQKAFIPQGKPKKSNSLSPPSPKPETLNPEPHRPKPNGIKPKCYKPQTLSSSTPTNFRVEGSGFRIWGLGFRGKGFGFGFGFGSYRL